MRPDTHALTFQPGPGRNGFVVVCSCGWKSNPVRLVWVNNTKQAHLKEVGADA